MCPAECGLRCVDTKMGLMRRAKRKMVSTLMWCSVRARRKMVDTIMWCSVEGQKGDGLHHNVV